MVTSQPAALSRQATPESDDGFYPLTVTKVVPETPDSASFEFEAPADRFHYAPGQFITLRVVIDGVARNRSYSMSSSPATGERLRVTVKRTPGGPVSNWLNDNLAEGDVIQAMAPAGRFVLDEGEHDIVAFAGGSGVTPVISILKTALATTSRRARLLYANRDRTSIIFAQQIDELVERYGDRLAVSHHLDVEHGFVDAQKAQAFAEGAPDAAFFICGPAPFMDVTERGVLASGVPARRVHLERFTTPEPGEAPPSPDLIPEAVKVTIKLAGRTAEGDYRAGATLLQTARQLGLKPPFSCEAGNCATCMAKIVEGSAVMHCNQALTPEEVAEGWVLTCQAVPTSAAVKVVYES